MTADRRAKLRHYPRRNIMGDMEIVDRQFDWVRCVLPYNYAYTCNAQQYREADLICLALEGPMESFGVVQGVILKGDT